MNHQSEHRSRIYGPPCQFERLVKAVRGEERICDDRRVLSIESDIGMRSVRVDNGTALEDTPRIYSALAVRMVEDLLS